MLDLLDENAKALFAFTKRLCCQVALGEVVDDLCEAYKTTTLIEERLNRVDAPETRTVFAQMPAIVPRGSTRQCAGEFSLGRTSCDVFGRKKEAKVLTDDHVFGVAKNTFGSDVPERDHALERNHEDRVVDQVLDQ
jgi:hypothetical protein